MTRRDFLLGQVSNDFALVALHVKSTVFLLHLKVKLILAPLGHIMSWISMNRYSMFFVQTSTLQYLK